LSDFRRKQFNINYPPEADQPFPPWAGLAEKVKSHKRKAKVKNKNVKMKPGNLCDRIKKVTESLLNVYHF